MPLDSDSLSRADLRALAVTTLTAAATLAGANVYADHAQPMDVTDLPLLLVSTPAERKETAGTGAPQFHTVITLAILARVAGASQPGTTVTAESNAEAQLDTIIDQVQQAIFCTPSMVMPIERFEFCETLATVSAEGEDMIGEATIMIGCRVYQGYEPDVGDPFTEIVVTVPPSQVAGSPVTVDIPLPQ